MTEDSFKLPKTIEEIRAITHVPTTEATTSFGNFVNKYLTNADNFDGITAEQAWTVIGCHRVWQSSEERKLEKEALKAEREQDAEKKKAEREEKKKEKAAEAAKKAELKEQKAKEKAAKEADNDSDLEEATDEEGLEDPEAEETEAKPKRRRRVAAATSGEF